MALTWQRMIAGAGLLLVGVSGCGDDAEPPSQTGSESTSSDAATDSDSESEELSGSESSESDDETTSGGDGDGDGDGDGEIECVEQGSWGEPVLLGDFEMQSNLLDRPWLGLDDQGRLAAFSRFMNAGLLRYDPDEATPLAPSGAWEGGIFGPRLAVLGAGDALLAWRSANAGANLYLARFSEGSTEFPSSQALNSGLSGESSPGFDLARLGSQEALAVFGMAESAELTLWASRFDPALGNAWSRTEIGTVPGQALLQAELGVDAQGDVLGLWELQQSDGDELWWNRYDASTDSWSETELLEEEGRRVLQLAVGSAGHGLLLLRDDGGPGRLWARTFDPSSGSWSEAHLLFELPGGAWYPFMNVHEPFVLSDGRALAAWSHQDDASIASLQWSLFEEGEWSTAAQLAQVTTAGIASVSLDGDACDRIWAAWGGSASGGEGVSVARFDASAGSFDAPSVLSMDPREVEGLQLASSPQGHVAAVWEVSDSNEPVVQSYAAILD